MDREREQTNRDGILLFVSVKAELQRAGPCALMLMYAKMSSVRGLWPCEVFLKIEPFPSALLTLTGDCLQLIGALAVARSPEAQTSYRICGRIERLRRFNQISVAVTAPVCRI